LHDDIFLIFVYWRGKSLFRGKKNRPDRDCQGFREKYYPQGGDFSTKPEGLDLDNSVKGRAISLPIEKGLSAPSSHKIHQLI